MEQKFLGNYRVFQEGVMVQGTWGNGLNPLDYINLTVNWKDQNVKYFIDVITLVLLICTVTKFKNIENKFYKYILIFGVISFILSTKLFPWDIFPKSFRIMQFPWRFVGFFMISASLLAPLSINSFHDKKTVSIILCIAIVLLSQPLLHHFSNDRVDLDNIDYQAGEGFQQEYFPVNLHNNLDYYNNRSDEVLNNTNKLADIKMLDNEVPHLKFSVETYGTVNVEIPRIYYVGYTLRGDNGNEYKIYENGNGFIETIIPSGVYTLDYTGTDIDSVCNVISFLFLIGYIALCMKRY